MMRLTILLLGLCTLCVGPPAWADFDPSRLAAIATSADTDTEVVPGVPPEGVSKPVRDASNEAWVAYFEYRTGGYAHRRHVFEWQHLSSRIIFVAVMLVVAVGLYFSWTQFHASDRGRDLGESSIEASKTGIRASSPVLGVVILALSIGFFYLYLVHVYPIIDAI